jgi:hypothetical protein
LFPDTIQQELTHVVIALPAYGYRALLFPMNELSMVPIGPIQYPTIVSQHLDYLPYFIPPHS